VAEVNISAFGTFLKRMSCLVRHGSHCVSRPTIETPSYWERYHIECQT
jgi:hypothetical protein